MNCNIVLQSETIKGSFAMLFVFP